MTRNGTFLKYAMFKKARYVVDANIFAATDEVLFYESQMKALDEFMEAATEKHAPYPRKLPRDMLMVEYSQSFVGTDLDEIFHKFWDDMSYIKTPEFVPDPSLEDTFSEMFEKYKKIDRKSVV